VKLDVALPIINIKSPYLDHAHDYQESESSVFGRLKDATHFQSLLTTADHCQSLPTFAVMMAGAIVLTSL
jgi:hypothetical protein